MALYVRCSFDRRGTLQMVVAADTKTEIGRVPPPDNTVTVLLDGATYDACGSLADVMQAALEDVTAADADTAAAMANQIALLTAPPLQQDPNILPQDPGT